MARGAAATAALPLIARAQSAQAERPDVLFIAIEDVSPHRFACYGNTVCKTPNLDRFAAQGLRFDQAHTCPPCCPSRTSLLLAKRPDTTGVLSNNHDWRKLAPDSLTMPAHLRSHGYETIRCGKMFHGGHKNAFEDDATWSRTIAPWEGLPPRKNKRRAPTGPGVEYAKRLPAAWKKGALIRVGRGRSIVTERWRYNEYRKDPKRAELFDQQNDPGEFVNLAKDPEYAEVKAELSALLNGGWKACLPDDG